MNITLRQLAQRSRNPEEGGITILLVLILLSIMTVSAFGISRNTLREIALTGNEATGRKAAEAADSGIDYTIVWSNPDANKSAAGVLDLTAVNANNGRKAIFEAMDNLLRSVGDDEIKVYKADPKPSDPGGTNWADYGNVSTSTGSLRVFVRSKDSGVAGTELFQAGKGVAGFTQDTDINQAFDVEVRYLGNPMGNQASGTKAKKKGSLFLIRSVGRANVATTGVSFIARREVLVEYMPSS